jgi:Protein of unknown function (DUF2865)
MSRLFLSRVASFLALAFVGMGPAWAQGVGYCDRLKAELAALESSMASSVNVDLSASIKKTQRELDRTTAYAHSIGCNDMRIPLLSGPAPAKCPSLEAQIGQLEQDLESLKQESARDQSGEAEARRDTLKATIDENCTNDASLGAPAPKAGGTTPFGGAFDNLQSSEMPDDPMARLSSSTANGFRTICVRKCDGYFFPISQFGANSRLSTDAELCHASCPGAEASLYVQPADKEVDSAVSTETGQLYTALPTAFHHRTAVDPSCSCQVPGKSWAEMLTDAERILGSTGQSDAQVTELKAQELSRPRDLKAPVKGKKGDPVPVIAQPSDVAALQNSIPAGTDIVPVGQGDLREITAPDGTKRMIRILRAPGAAAVTAVQ